MKGVVFTELSEFVEGALGFDMADGMMEAAKAKGGGVYTQAGTYPFEELVAMVVYLSEQTGKSVGELLFIFGRHLFTKLVLINPDFARQNTTTFDFIAAVDRVIHVEVKKLYPKAELPKFSVESQSSEELVLLYESEKKLEELAKGLMVGCADHFGEEIEIEYEMLSENPHCSKFRITKA